MTQNNTSGAAGRHTRKKTAGAGKKVGAIALTALILGGGFNTSAAFANGGGGGGVPGSGHGNSGAWDLYNMQYDAMHEGTVTPVQGYMQGSTEWFLNNYNGPGGEDPAQGIGAKDQIRAACNIALERAEARGDGSGKSRVVGIMWAGSQTSPWASYSSADASFFQQRWDQAVVGAGFPGVYQEGAKPFMQQYWPEALAGGGATPSAVCIALNQDEPPQFTTNPPVKQLLKGDGSPLPDDGVLVAGQSYVAKIEVPANGHTGEMSLWDTIQTDKVWIGAQSKDDVSQVTVLDPSGNKVSAQVTVHRPGGATNVQASVQVPEEHRTGVYTLLVPTYVLPTGTGYDVKDGSFVTYNGDGRIDGNEEKTRKVTPTPDKSWVLDENGALTTADPDWSNNTGADNKVFLPGEAIAAVVNDYLPKNLATPMSNYEIADDWSDAVKYIDFSDASKAKVYVESKPGSKKFTDVTDQFTVTVDPAGVTIAKAKKGSKFLKETAGQSGEREVKLISSGAFRTDYATQGETVKMLNKGWVVWGTEKKPTNEPPIYTWTPDPNKQVVGSGEEAGDNAHENIHGMSIWPGQKATYVIGIDLNVPGALGYGVKNLGVEDTYDPQVIPDKTSIKVWDSRDPKNAKLVPKSAYKVTWDDAKNTWTLMFTDAWLKDNLDASSQWFKNGWLSVQFDITAKDDAIPGSTVKNQAFQIVNDSRTATEIPEVKIPNPKPDKEDLSTDLINIDGKTVVEGDTIIYRLTLDASMKQEELAYYVHKLGMIDDYDEEYLKLDMGGVRITNQATGEDVTAKFNLQDKDGTFYAFAKQVDSTGPKGDLLKGDPQPADLKKYAEATIDPAVTPIIDEKLMGNFYSITLPMKVIKSKDGYVIENQAVQNIENTNLQTKIVSNPLKQINPDKDVVAKAGGKDSIDGTEVKLDSEFNYLLNSSTIPADRAYQASQWSITDAFDRVHDQYTGIWAVYASTDVYNGDELVFKKGDLIQSSESKDAKYFQTVFDEASYTFSIEALPAYLDLVNSRGDLAQQFSVYTKMIRIAPAEQVVNVFDESYNEVIRKSDKVVTRTPENPAIDIEKYTLDEGMKKGDRDKLEDAYPVTEAQLKDGVKVGFRITNTGDVPLQNVKFGDVVINGTKGEVEDITCDLPGLGDKVSPSELATLAVGESIDCTGLLQGMQKGDIHSDNATVTAESVYTKKKVSDEDPWHAKAPAKPIPEQLAETGGAGIAGLAGSAIALLGGGAALAFFADRRNRRKLQAAENGGASE